VKGLKQFHRDASTIPKLPPRPELLDEPGRYRYVATSPVRHGPRRDQFERQSAMLLRIANDGVVPETFKDAAEVVALATEVRRCCGASGTVASCAPRPLRQHHQLNEDLKNQAYRAAIASLAAVPPH